MLYHPGTNSARQHPSSYLLWPILECGIKGGPKAEDGDMVIQVDDLKEGTQLLYINLQDFLWALWRVKLSPQVSIVR